MRTVLAVAAFGALGCVLRLLVSNWLVAHWPRHFYLGTLAVNIAGCLLIGLLAGLFLRVELPVELRSGLTAGLLGGLTTFSAFSLDAIKLLESGRVGEALGYLLLSVLTGLLAAWLGLALMRMA